ncbi:MAG: hypothetical protein BWX49_00056 [Bacteroidetes bacterium ADurb.Bin008]|nr:MAG: hypothetical protein BWX49_00056 [Bacteroidetes bacterium ADurb.Bin008]
MHEFYFERLEVWQEARSFVKDIYEATKEFPLDERYGMVMQIRRAAISIAANVAEGMARNTQKDKARFINQAFGSAIEVLNFIILANDFNWIDAKQYSELREKNEKITNQLNSLYNKLSE